MKEILQVLSESKCALTLMETIFTIKGLEDHTDTWYSGNVILKEGGKIEYSSDYQEHVFVPIQNRLASALAKRIIPNINPDSRLDIAFLLYKYPNSKDNPDVKHVMDEVENEEKYLEQADCLYTIYSRAMKTLLMAKVVECVGYSSMKREGKENGYRNAPSYILKPSP